MTDNRNLTDYSPDTGLGFIKSNRVLTYLYGLSDFWATTFSDIETVNLMMEANAFEASEIYNKFLQLTSSLSLEDIQVKLNSQITLIYLTEGDLTSYPATYNLPDGISYSRYIANRPFLPTSSLEEGVDFTIDEVKNTISFAKLLSENNFIYRLLPDGTKKYALWLVDVKTDNPALYTEYANLLGLDKPSSITENFKNFVYGMYYLYTHGPNLDLIRRGLNMALGIPISREDETVLEIRKYLETDQEVVITNFNSYIIPYGLTPSVSEGDIITVGTGLADWVEIKDYINDGDWWINLRLPSSLIPNVPFGVSRYATEGSIADEMMRKYLKTHTFLVNIKTTNFKNLQEFAELSDIIHEIKPAYTSPIYFWSITIEGDDLTINDDLAFPVTQSQCTPLTDPISRFTRNSTNPLTRGCAQFLRFTAPESVNRIIGLDPDTNGISQNTGIGTVTGFINQNSAIRPNNESENAWIRSLWSKAGPYYFFPKGHISRLNNIPVEGPGEGYNYLMNLYPGFRIVVLYCTLEPFVEALFNANSLALPQDYVFTLFESSDTIGSINEVAINDGEEVSNSLLTTEFSTYMIRNPLSDNLGANLPIDIIRTFTPQVGDIRANDFLVFVRNSGHLITVYWATSNMEYNIPPYFAHKDSDAFSLQVSGNATMGLAINNQPAYMMMDYALLETGYLEEDLNGFDLNGSPYDDTLYPTYDVKYSDTQNVDVSLSKSGTTLEFKRAWA